MPQSEPASVCGLFHALPAKRAVPARVDVSAETKGSSSMLDTRPQRRGETPEPKASFAVYHNGHNSRTLSSCQVDRNKIMPTTSRTKDATTTPTYTNSTLSMLDLIHPRGTFSRFLKVLP